MATCPLWRPGSVNLDEYWAVLTMSRESYRYFMQDNLFDHIDIHPENTTCSMAR